MPTPPQDIQLVESKAIEDFIPLLREIDLGDRFLLSMLHWCGIGRRATPLDFWRVMLIRRGSDAVGISGLYRQPGMENSVLWIGWFGIRPAFRRSGLGRAAIEKLVEVARRNHCRQLWVYTGATDKIAILFYQSLGFSIAGAARDVAYGRTSDDADVVLRRNIEQ
jgi:ribosomal protein S18 acetylase RimI-like enzyme